MPFYRRAQRVRFAPSPSRSSCVRYRRYFLLCVTRLNNRYVRYEHGTEFTLAALPSALARFLRAAAIERSEPNENPIVLPSRILARRVPDSMRISRSERENVQPADKIRSASTARRVRPLSSVPEKRDFSLPLRDI